MSLSLKFETHRDFLVFTISGPFTVSDACSAFHEVLRLAAQHGMTKLLLDCLQIEGTLTAADRYVLGEFVARELVVHIERQKVLPRLVVVAKEPQRDPNRLAELVARNRGAEVKVVDRMEEALKWLGVSGENETGAKIG